MNNSIFYKFTPKTVEDYLLIFNDPLLTFMSGIYPHSFSDPLQIIKDKKDLEFLASLEERGLVTFFKNKDKISLKEITNI